MRPLKEKTGPTFALEADAIDLLRAARAHEVMPGRKQRVRARLLEQRVTRRARLFRPVVALAVVLLAAAASAAVERHWIARTVRSWVASAAHQRLAVSTQPARRTSDNDGVASVERIPSASESPTVVALTAIGDPPLVGERAVIAKRPSVAMRLALAKHAPVARWTVRSRRGSTTRSLADAAPENHSRGTSQSDETGLVYEAMRALRQEGRPTRAARLLAEYLRVYPAGALAEEALALSVEAAATRGDTRGEELARQYFARYPSGHFQAAVETARARLSP